MTSLHEGPETDSGDLYNRRLLLATSMEARIKWILMPRNSPELRQPCDTAKHLSRPDRSTESFHRPRQIWEGRLAITTQGAIGISS